MGTADVQGELWGAHARDYADIVEPFFRPAFERVLSEAGAGPGQAVLDVGCATGLACAIAAGFGAQVAGIDGAEASLAIARERTPSGDFRRGDMESLPWADGSFDVVTGFNSFQFASDINAALREAARVTRAGGRVAMLVWGRDEDCETTVTTAAVRELLPPSPPGPSAPPLWTPGRMEELLEAAGLAPRSSGDIDCRFVFADLETAVRGLMSAGGVVAAGRQVGEERVREAVAASFTSFRGEDGHYVQRNRYRYVIAEA